MMPFYCIFFFSLYVNTYKIYDISVEYCIKGSLQHPLIEGCQSIKRIIWASLALPDFVNYFNNHNPLSYIYLYGNKAVLFTEISFWEVGGEMKAGAGEADAIKKILF